MLPLHSIAPARRILLYPREDGPAAFPSTSEAAAWLVERGVGVAVPTHVHEQRDNPWLELPDEVVPVDLEALPADFDLAVALGGDGTLLRASRWVADLDVPVLGINLGDLGFLSAYGREQIVEALADALAGRLSWEPRQRMQVEVLRRGERFGQADSDPKRSPRRRTSTCMRWRGSQLSRPASASARASTICSRP
nr:NAD(+)/NADH kinase [Pseudenhygromyxa sp. WMMC2535]